MKKKTITDEFGMTLVALAILITCAFVVVGDVQVLRTHRNFIMASGDPDVTTFGDFVLLNIASVFIGLMAGVLFVAVIMFTYLGYRYAVQHKAFRITMISIAIFLLIKWILWHYVGGNP